MWNGRVGVWSRELRFSRDREDARDAAAELEELGYAALWIPDVGGDVFGACEELLAATRSIPLLTGILNIWMHDAAEVAARSAALGERFTLGLGASHEAVIGERYAKPLSAMRAYLDELDVLGSGDRLLAALGPKMLELSRTRAAGAHPYLVPVEHTRQAREILGPDRALAVEQGVVLAPDRAAARAHVAAYLELPNYVANLRRLGYGDADFAGGGSDALVDALVAWGDEEAIAERVRAQLEAGADHVCIQVIDAVDDTPPRDAWRRIAPALIV
ncbi:TIGR03620 family F420-dependent LLM class oxidoreductase [Solirubrobacter ginsenosidimutans]|uniref:TIGR03620 family F420-dependent LLM class oxidoreductase n=1 Tax=Solirubrobacter ginsenosidimutans TaxID=490573 RepID=A0A9X3S450_9ACTN|nr:TIGR03620 family F420-dependent LLM class oxidoreductase [Solirubrobacter ginsenosidimutans]MDA0165314.1 TIGR03620 family F420-dependent LLM class oxidoreductase [Solirubrobacter ginsenosidimutans]